MLGANAERMHRLSLSTIPLALTTLLLGCGSHRVTFELDDQRAWWDTGPACSGFESYADGPAHAWAVGSELRLILGAVGGLGECTLTGKIPLPNCTDRTPPVNAQIVSSDPSVWEIVSGPDADNVVVVRAVSEGVAEITVSADNANPGTLELRAVTPASLRAVWPNYDGEVALDHVNLGTGASALVRLEVLDAGSEVLCVPAASGSVVGRGVTLFSETSTDPVGDPPTLGRSITIQAGETETDAQVDVTLGEWSATLSTPIIAPASLTRLSLETAQSFQTAADVRVRTWIGEEEVIGGSVLLETLTPDVARWSDPLTGEDVAMLTTRNGSELLDRSCTYDEASNEFVCVPGDAQVRGSIVGSSAAPVTLTVTFAP